MKPDDSPLFDASDPSIGTGWIHNCVAERWKGRTWNDAGEFATFVLNQLRVRFRNAEVDVIEGICAAAGEYPQDRPRMIWSRVLVLSVEDEAVSDVNLFSFEFEVVGYCALKGNLESAPECIQDFMGIFEDTAPNDDPPSPCAAEHSWNLCVELERRFDAWIAAGGLSSGKPDPLSALSTAKLSAYLEIMQTPGFIPVKT